MPDRSCPAQTISPVPIFPLAGLETVRSVLRRLPDACLAALPEADSVGVSVVSRGHELAEGGCSDELARTLDAYQHASDEGPCPYATRAAIDVIKVDDLEDDDRWPGFASEATALGIHSVLSVKLRSAQVALGALNIYAAAPRCFTGRSGELARAIAAQASWALRAVMRSENLEVALASRDVIGQAKGILMERYKISAEQAFETLIRISKRSNVKLRDVAGELAATGELPAEVARYGATFDA
jgi:GAF domain-containing protein